MNGRLRIYHLWPYGYQTIRKDFCKESSFHRKLNRVEIINKHGSNNNNNNNNNTPFYCPPSWSTTITEVHYNRTICMADLSFQFVYGFCFLKVRRNLVIQSKCTFWLSEIAKKNSEIFFGDTHSLLILILKCR